MEISFFNHYELGHLHARTHELLPALVVFQLERLAGLLELLEVLVVHLVEHRVKIVTNAGDRFVVRPCLLLWLYLGWNRSKQRLLDNPLLLDEARSVSVSSSPHAHLEQFNQFFPTLLLRGKALRYLRLVCDVCMRACCGSFRIHVLQL